MLALIDLLILFFAYIIPLYFANATPVVIHGSIPVDGGRLLNGKPFLGKGKTILGTLAGIIFGTLFGALVIFFYPAILISIPQYFALALLLSIGALLGDMVKSFIKRRVGITSGAQWLVADQIDFVIGGLLLSLFVRIPELEVVVLVLAVTLIAHVASNFAAFKMKLKKVPW